MLFTWALTVPSTIASCRPISSLVIPRAINPSTSTIILKSETAPAPVTYSFTKETAFVDAQGNVVSYETIKNAAVSVEYIRDGDRTIVKRVVATRPSAVTHKEETTTHTETN